MAEKISADQSARLVTKAEIEKAQRKLEKRESLLKDAIKTMTKTMKDKDKVKKLTKKRDQAKEKLKSLLTEAIIYQGARVRKLEGEPGEEKALKRQERLRADYKEATGSEWSDVRDEGPILMTSNEVNGREVRMDLEQRLLELRRQNVIR